MPLLISTLRTALEKAQGDDSFKIAPVDLGFADMTDLFTRFLPDGLLEVAGDVSVDVDALSICGKVVLLGQAASDARVVFLPDGRGECVAGARIDVVLLPDGPGLPAEVAQIPQALARIGLGPLHLVFGVEPGSGDGPTARIGFGAELLFPAAEADPRPYVWGYLPLREGQSWSVSGTFPDVPLDSPDDLLGFAGLRPGELQIPPDLGGAPALALTGLAIAFLPREARDPDGSSALDGSPGSLKAPVSFDWTEASMTVGLGTCWEIVPGAVTVDHLAAVFTVEDPFGAPALTTGAAGQVTLGPGVVMTVTGTRSAAGNWSFRGHAQNIVPAELFQALGLTAPAFLADMTVEQLSVEFDDQGRIAIGLRSALDLTQNPAVLELRCEAERGSSATRLSGTLVIPLATADGGIREMVFVVDAGSGEDGRWLAARWDGGSDHVGALDLTSAFGLGAPPETPQALVPNLTTVALWYEPGTGQLALGAVAGFTTWAVVTLPDPSSAQRRLYAAAGGASISASASQLPLVGDLVPAEFDLTISRAGFALASAGWGPAAAEAANGMLAAAESLGDGSDRHALPRFAEVDTAAVPGLVLALDYAIGGAPQPSLALVVWQPSGSGTVVAPAALEEFDGASRDLNLAIGPLRIKRAVLGYGERVFLALEATLAVGPAEFSLLGLGIAVDAGSFAVTPVLMGAAVLIEKPPLRIAGMFENRLDPEYSALMTGVVTAETGFFALTALGSYARSREGWSSLFLFGEAGAAGGVALFGPPAFTVTGLSGGFGVNSSVRVPAIGELESFPLIARLGDSGELTPQEMLNRLMGPDGWLRPVPDQYWGAVGVQFTSFKFIDSRALALVEFGNSLTVMLLGRTSVTFPRNASKAKKVHARLNIDLKLAYVQAQGLLSMDVAVADGSFVFSESVRLTGGIAVYVWTGGPRRGDFAISAGGYHPSYRPPAHYPVPAKLGFVWSPDDKVRVSAQGYTALTPNALMLGGRLAATYKKGQLSAWFTAHLDVLIQWNPFYLELSLGVQIGVKYVIKVLFIKVPVKIEVGVDIDLWTPQLGGRVTVHVWFVSFKFDFGAARPSLPTSNWQEFRAQLPDPVSMTPLAGLLADVDASELAARRAVEAPTLIASAGFVLATESAVPASALYVNDAELPADGGAVNIRPMGLTDLTSEHRVTIRRNFSDEYFDWEGYGWQITPVTRDVPSALWGKPGRPSLNEGLIEDKIGGLLIKVPPPTRGDEVGPVTSKALGAEQLPPGCTPLRDPAATGPAPAENPDSPRIITQTVAAADIRSRRSAVHAALDRFGLDLAADDGSLTGYAQRAETTLTDAPLVLPATTMAG
ncbi:DUF6603 domain-containing protein [Streptomyces sp. NPDC005989]|uniref:DUF6603 domain-containing protein n=1 Tax=Streptomyces sp. NPDC005989 TaxID=3156727 RepID=UPI0033C16EF2